MSKIQEKEKAIELRKQGLSYNEILKEVPAAKSTLSLWLRSVGLSIPQKQRLTERKLASMKRGWEACRRRRIQTTNKIKCEAANEIGIITERDLWIAGIALYWAEGTKERSKAINLQLNNSDASMIKVFIKWIKSALYIEDKRINFSIYIHINHKYRILDVQKYWSKATGYPIEKFQNIVWKKHNPKTVRKNIGDDYFGLVRITVLRSSDLARKVAGWIEGFSNNCRVV